MFNDKSSLLETINQFDHGHHGSPVIALRENVKDKQSEVPIHQHTMGQLVFALKGGVTCQLPQSTVIVPPQCAVWIPKGVLHRVNATANAQFAICLSVQTWRHCLNPVAPCLFRRWFVN